MRKLGMLAIAALIGLTGAACGDDDDTAGDVDDVADLPSGDEIDDVLGMLDDECQFLLAGSFLNPMASLSPGSDVNFEASADQLDAIADKAPEEIRDDMRTVAEGFARMAEVFADVDLNDPNSFADPEVAEAIGELDTVFDEEYEAASERVSDYMEENCGADG